MLYGEPGVVASCMLTNCVADESIHSVLIYDMFFNLITNIFFANVTVSGSLTP